MGIPLVKYEDNVRGVLNKVIADYPELILEDVIAVEDVLTLRGATMTSEGLVQQTTWEKPFRNECVLVHIDYKESVSQTEIRAIIEDFFEKYDDADIYESNDVLRRLRRVEFVFPNQNLNKEIRYSDLEEKYRNWRMIQSDRLDYIDQSVYSVFTSSFRKQFLNKNNLEYAIERMGKQDEVFIVDTVIYFYILQEEDDFSEMLERVNEETIELIREEIKLQEDLQTEEVKKIRFTYRARWYEGKDYQEPFLFEYDL